MLLEKDVAPERFAIPCLHFRSAHPETLRVYDFLKRERIPRVSLKDAVLSLKDIIITKKLPIYESINLSNTDILFISHLTSLSQINQISEDIYFGELPNILARSGYNIIIALINHATDDVRFWNHSDNRPNHVNRILLSQRLDRDGEYLVSRKLKSVSRQLLVGSNHKALRELASWQAQTSSSRQVLRISEQIRYLVRCLQPRAMMFTYEGNAWERMAMWAARSSAPNIKCFAFQHSVLLPMQDAMIRRYGPKFDPDVIFASGRVGLDWLKSKQELSNIPIQLLGSPRSFKINKTVEIKNSNLRCLFLPEGLVSESLYLARAAFSLARMKPNITCVIRLHPLMSVSKLIKLDRDLTLNLSNIEWSVSEMSLLEDVKRSRWAVYRGSSSIITAVSEGLEPIYLGEEVFELRIDPLKTISGLSKVAHNLEELANIIDANKSSLVTHKKKLANACEYYTPLNPGVLIHQLLLPKMYS